MYDCPRGSPTQARRFPTRQTCASARKKVKVTQCIIPVSSFEFLFTVKATHKAWHMTCTIYITRPWVCSCVRFNLIEKVYVRQPGIVYNVQKMLDRKYLGAVAQKKIEDDLEKWKMIYWAQTFIHIILNFAISYNTRRVRYILFSCCGDI